MNKYLIIFFSLFDFSLRSCEKNGKSPDTKTILYPGKLIKYDKIRNRLLIRKTKGPKKSCTSFRSIPAIPPDVIIINGISCTL